MGQFSRRLSKSALYWMYTETTKRFILQTPHIVASCNRVINASTTLNGEKKIESIMACWASSYFSVATVWAFYVEWLWESAELSCGLAISAVNFSPATVSSGELFSTIHKAEWWTKLTWRRRRARDWKTLRKPGTSANYQGWSLELRRLRCSSLSSVLSMWRGNPFA